MPLHSWVLAVGTSMSIFFASDSLVAKDMDQIIQDLKNADKTVVGECIKILGGPTTPLGTHRVTVFNPTRGGSRFLIAGQNLHINDKVITDTNQTVILRLSENSEITVAPKSTFLVEAYDSDRNQQTTLKLFYGMLHLLVRKIYTGNESFVVKTPTAVLGVRGTEFIVETDPSGHETKAYTLQGEVAVGQNFKDLYSHKNAIRIGPGETTSIRPGMKIPEAAKPFDPPQFHRYMEDRAPEVTPRMQHFTPPVHQGLEHSRDGQTPGTRPHESIRRENAPQPQSRREKFLGRPQQKPGGGSVDRGRHVHQPGGTSHARPFQRPTPGSQAQGPGRPHLRSGSGFKRPPNPPPHGAGPPPPPGANPPPGGPH